MSDVYHSNTYYSWGVNLVLSLMISHKKKYFQMYRKIKVRKLLIHTTCKISNSEILKKLKHHFLYNDRFKLLRLCNVEHEQESSIALVLLVCRSMFWISSSNRSRALNRYTTQKWASVKTGAYAFELCLNLRAIGVFKYLRAPCWISRRHLEFSGIGQLRKVMLDMPLYSMYPKYNNVFIIQVSVDGNPLLSRLYQQLQHSHTFCIWPPAFPPLYCNHSWLITTIFTPFHSQDFFSNSYLRVFLLLRVTDWHSVTRHGDNPRATADGLN